MADSELDALLEQVKNGSPFESLRAATKLSEIARVRKDRSSVMTKGDLRRAVRDLAQKGGGLNDLQQIIDEVRSADEPIDATIPTNDESSVSRTR